MSAANFFLLSSRQAQYFSIITFFIVLIFDVSVIYGEENAIYTECERPFNCGRLQKLSYPFWGGNRPQICGREGFKLNCDDANNYPTLTGVAQEFVVLYVNQSSKEITMARKDLQGGICPNTFSNITFNTTLYNIVPGLQNLTLAYDCPTAALVNSTVLNNTCSINGEDSYVFYATDEQWNATGSALVHCKRVEIPVLLDLKVIGELILGGLKAVKELLENGFNVSFDVDNDISIPCSECMNSGGVCGTNVTQSGRFFTCLCPDQAYPDRCPMPVKGRSRGSRWRQKVGIGVGAAFGGGILMCIVFFIYQHRTPKKYGPSFSISRCLTSDPSSKAEIEKGVSYFGVHLFTYAELEEATSNFDSSKELGDGGFGSVYYGKLRDGRTVAVKRLYENNYKRVEQFMNEIEILTRLRHRHLVSLYGCTSRHSRELLLVYEYIPNGTVADHLHGDRVKPGALPWSIRMNIAVETASALKYLHASDIIHRDVKTNNILLDNNFCVKVADFGLSRLFPTDVTHVSTAPQGTPGYVDPEYHQCYQLTDKSDVYSFGVVLIELISSMPAVDITRHRHEINLANLAINRIQSHSLHELVDPNLGFESDYATGKMITAVAELAFQCLQSEKDTRPCMAEVLEILEQIRNQEYSTEVAEKLDIRADLELLKNGPQLLSPDSVTFRWISPYTTSSSSG